MRIQHRLNIGFHGPKGCYIPLEDSLVEKVSFITTYFDFHSAHDAPSKEKVAATTLPHLPRHCAGHLALLLAGQGRCTRALGLRIRPRSPTQLACFTTLERVRTLRLTLKDPPRDPLPTLAQLAIQLAPIPTTARHNAPIGTRVIHLTGVRQFVKQ